MNVEMGGCRFSTLHNFRLPEFRRLSKAAEVALPRGVYASERSKDLVG